MVELSISKDILVTLPRVLFDGKIVIVDNHIKSNIAISKLRKETLLGIDTETRPSFRRGVIHKVALLQISTFNECYLFRTNKIGMPQGVLQLLQDERVTKIGLSLRDDMLKLGEICNINPKGLIDIQDFVKKYGIIDNSLQRIYGIVFNRDISKSQQLTNWEAPLLTDAQCAYAATDAWACLKLYDELINNRFDYNNSRYIVEPHSETIEHED